SDRMTFEPVNAALTLLEVDGVGREVPMRDRVAVQVKVESLLPNRRCGQHEGPERAVEGLADLVNACTLAIFGALFGKSSGETRAHPVVLDRDGSAIRGHGDVVYSWIGGPNRDRLYHRLGDLLHASFRVLTGHPQPFHQ